MTAAYFEDHPTDPDKVILRKRPCPYCNDTPRTWVGLTDDEIEMIYAITIKIRKKDIMPEEQKMFARTIQKLLEEKNK